MKRGLGLLVVLGLASFIVLGCAGLSKDVTGAGPGIRGNHPSG